MITYSGAIISARNYFNATTFALRFLMQIGQYSKLVAKTNMVDNMDTD